MKHPALPNSSNASKVKTSADKLAHRAVEAAARQSYGRLVALLAARTATQRVRKMRSPTHCSRH
jgi:hypothetical protein